jgi:hypothetical protein
MVPLSRGFDYRPGLSLGGLTARQALQPQGACPLVWAIPRSLAATSGITDLFSFPAGTEMVHFPALPSAPYVFRDGYSGITQSGFPHSEIPGSKPACGSPRLIAACHVLHRLLAPRHSPYALSSLINLNISTALRVCGQRTTDCRVFSCQRVSSCCGLTAVANSGGEYRDRTGDLLVANQALSQLS